MSHLPEALQLAQLGWKVFALGPTGHPYPNCKECRRKCLAPLDYENCDHLICHATYAGTSDPTRLKAMWGQLPHSLIGVRTGAPSGIVVIDFDLHNAAKNGWLSAQKLQDKGWTPRTVSGMTGGGGLHLIYSHPGVPIPNNNTGKLGPGADVKGEGGFVIAPPSAKRGKLSYSWVPGLDPWSQTIASLSEEAVMAITKSDDKPIKFSGENVTESNENLIEKWEYALAQARSAGVGERNANLYYAACRGGEVVASGKLPSQQVIDLLEEAGREARLTSGEIRQTIRSGLGRGHADYSSQEES